MQRLRVGVDATGLTSAKAPTGLERYSHALVKQLAAQRNDENLEVFLYMPRRPHVGLPHLDVPASAEGFHWRIAPIARGWYRVGMGLAMRLDRIDVMHFPVPHMARYCPVPSVVTIHDLAAISLEASLTKKERDYLADAREAGRRATTLIAVSASSGAEIERYFGRRDYEMIHASPDEGRFRPESPAAIAELHAEYNLPPYILCVGTLQARKNHLRLIDAFESIAHRIPHTLVLVGRDGSSANEVHERLAQRPNPRIRLLGYFPERQLAALYSGAAAVVFPSLWEGFGLPILEAMVCDTPVLTSNISSLAEVAGDAALTVDPRSTEDIADKLYRLLTDETLRETLRQRGRERAKEFSWPESARRIIKLYRRTAALGQRGQTVR